MRIKINDKIYRLEEIESGVDSLMELVEEPRYKDGDFVVNMLGDILIFKKKEGNLIYDHAYLQNGGILWIAPNKETTTTIERLATEEKKQTLLDALEKEGKRWNAEKLCVEDIPDELNFKEGDFLVKEYNDNDIYIFVLDRITECGTIYYHCHHSPTYDTTEIDSGYGIGRIGDYLHKSLRYADESEKNLLVAELAKKGKRWNAEKLCVEDIPQPKFKKGDKVRIKHGVSSKTHQHISPGFIVLMDDLIGEELTVDRYANGMVYTEESYYFHEEWLEPYVEELKKGDLAIFWQFDKTQAVVRLFENEQGGLFQIPTYVDNTGHWWANAIKFESKEQYERFIKGEI